MKSAAEFPHLPAKFFTDRLMRQRQASPHAIAGCRGIFCLLVQHALRELRKAPATLDIGDLDTDFLGAFLTHLETERGYLSRKLCMFLGAGGQDRQRSWGSATGTAVGPGRS